MYLRPTSLQCVGGPLHGKFVTLGVRKFLHKHEGSPDYVLDFVTLSGGDHRHVLTPCGQAPTETIAGLDRIQEAEKEEF